MSKNKEYVSYKNYPTNKWRWENFTPFEMRSKGDGKLMIDPASMDKLQALRDLVGKPMLITSAYRSPAHNRFVKGRPKSQHLLAKAFDIPMDSHDPAQFEAAARKCGFTSFGFYPKSNFIHIDTRARAATWGKRWFERAAAYKPPRKVRPQPPTKQPDQPPAAGKAGQASVWAAIIRAILRAFGKGD